jgi:hypothetical protein
VTVVQVLVGLAVGGFLLTLLFALVTGRVAWRQTGCCAADPRDDARIAAALREDAQGSSRA